MSRTVLEPSVDHPITVEPTPGEVVVEVDGVVVARTTAALTLQESTYPPVQYVPLADVDPSVLRPSATSTYCPYKGDASYFSVALGDAEPLDDITWAYTEPYPAVAAIAGHVAFYADRPEVSVRVA